MKYEIGLMDMYPIEGSGSDIENDPMFKVVMKEAIDHVKLEDAVYRAIRFHPLFGTQLEFDKLYYFATNNRPVRLINSIEDKRPLEFGRDSNGYPWQICWFGKEFTLEWNHGVTDANGTLAFLKSILSFYCDIKAPVVPRKIDLGPGLEPFYDRKEKGINYKVQPAGFLPNALPIYKRGYRTDCHSIKGSTEEVLRVSRENESSPAALISVILSLAIRKHLPENIRNRRVATNVAINLRKALDYETMHNCVEFIRLTYEDKHDEMGFDGAAKDFKAALDNIKIRENAVRLLSGRVTDFKTLHILPGKTLRKKAMWIIGKLLRNLDCNCELTYLGNSNMPEEVVAQVEDLRFRCWTDFGNCTIAAIDYDGSFNIDLCENYIDKGIVEDFINISKEIGINFEITEEFEYEQARFIEETEQDKTASYTADVSDEIPNVYSRVDDTKKADMPAI